MRADWRARTEPVLPREKMDTRSIALVVDDSITVRRVTQRLLERNGMRVLTARDGVDAMEMLQEHTPDIILLDIEMPRMDGYEVATQVRTDSRLAGIPIIMITSRVGEKHRARAIEIGVDDYLGKPYQEAQLLEAIEPLIARRREAHLREANHMAERISEIYSLLIPLLDGRLIIPRSCVAEVVGFARRRKCRCAAVVPGHIRLGQSQHSADFFRRNLRADDSAPRRAGRESWCCSRWASQVEGGYYGMVSQGFPQLVRVSADILRPDPTKTFPERTPIISQVRMINEAPWIPDLERIEEMISEETSVLVE